MHVLTSGADGKLETSRYAIFKDYAKGWMVVDVLSTIPYDSLATYRGGSLFKIMKVYPF